MVGDDKPKCILIGYESLFSVLTVWICVICGWWWWWWWCSDVGINCTGRESIFAVGSIVDGGIEKIFVAWVCCCGGCQKWLLVVVTNFDELFVVDDDDVDDDDEDEDDVDEEFVINGCTSVTRFFDKNTDWLELVEEVLSVVDISFVDDIVTLFNVWILGDVVPGGINVNNDDDVVFDGLFTVVVLLCWGFNIYVFDVENDPFVVDLSVNWNGKFVGGEDLPVGVTRRIDDGVVVVVVEFVADDVECLRLFVGLSRCESAREKKTKIVWFLFIILIYLENTYGVIIFSQSIMDLPRRALI